MSSVHTKVPTQKKMLKEMYPPVNNPILQHEFHQHRKSKK